MEIIVGTLIILLTFYLVIRPFLTKQKTWMPDAIEDDLDEISLTGIYATINELDMEYEMGKLAEKDYRQLKQKYESLAIEAMKKQDQVKESKQTKTDKELDEEIERELASLRKARDHS